MPGTFDHGQGRVRRGLGEETGASDAPRGIAFRRHRQQRHRKRRNVAHRKGRQRGWCGKVAPGVAADDRFNQLSPWAIGQLHQRQGKHGPAQALLLALQGQRGQVIERDYVGIGNEPGQGRAAQQQGRHARRVADCERQGDRGALRQAAQRNAIQPQGVGDPNDVISFLQQIGRGGRSAEPAPIGHDDPEMLAERRDLRGPHPPVESPAMEQEQRRPLASTGKRQGTAVNNDLGQLDVSQIGKDGRWSRHGTDRHARDGSPAGTGTGTGAGLNGHSPRQGGEHHYSAGDRRPASASTQNWRPSAAPH